MCETRAFGTFLKKPPGFLLTSQSFPVPPTLTPVAFVGFELAALFCSPATEVVVVAPESVESTEVPAREVSKKY